MKHILNKFEPFYFDLFPNKHEDYYLSSDVENMLKQAYNEAIDKCIDEGKAYIYLPGGMKEDAFIDEKSFLKLKKL